MADPLITHNWRRFRVALHCVVQPRHGYVVMTTSLWLCNGSCVVPLACHLAKLPCLLLKDLFLKSELIDFLLLKVDLSLVVSKPTQNPTISNLRNVVYSSVILTTVLLKLLQPEVQTLLEEKNIWFWFHQLILCIDI